MISPQPAQRRNGRQKRRTFVLAFDTGNYTIYCAINCINEHPSDMAYVDSHPLHGAFVAHKLDRLSDLIVEQGNALLRDAGVKIPSRTVSLLLLIGDRGQLSAADIASTLGQPHQLVTQRIDVLMGLALVERKADAEDARRKILSLTTEGEQHYAALTTLLAKAAMAFAELSDEIGCDLAIMAMKAIDALGRASLVDRIRSRSSLPSDAVTADGV
jgi:DNA-binding MarR family transcriptional regulator